LVFEPEHDMKITFYRAAARALSILLVSFSSCKPELKKQSEAASVKISEGEMAIAKCRVEAGSESTTYYVQANDRKSNIGSIADTVPPKVVWIPGGNFAMGSEDPEFPDAGLIHNVTLDGFWMDEHKVTNAEFAVFVEATGYVTVAERPLNPADYPEAPADKLVPGSGVFTPPAQPVSFG
jgi:formylglycine-generating enzyme required for sulfatase activity